MQQIKNLFSILKKTDKTTERGELMQYFLGKLNPPRKLKRLKPLSFPRMGKIIQGIPTKDLYYLKSVCDDHEKRGNSWGTKFWWEIKPHEQLQ